MAAGVAGAHSPLTPNKWNPIPLCASDPVPGLGFGFAAVRLRLNLLLQDFLAARAAAAAAWLHCISSHTKNHRGAQPQTANTKELTRMGSFSLWEYSPQRLGRVADLCRTWDGAEGMPSELGRVRRGLYLQVWWQKSSESLASPPLLCRMSCGVRCHCFLVLYFLHALS